MDRIDVLISAEEIQTAVARVAQQISTDYRGRPLTILGVMTGSLMFLADLIRQLDMPLQVGMIQASSYRGTQTTPGMLRINADFLPRLENRDVLLLDDIFDTGQTLNALCMRLADPAATSGSPGTPRSLKSAVLLWKTGRQTVAMQPDYFGFRIPDQFVVGYGLDFNNEYRHLPYVGVVHPATPLPVA